MERSRRQPSNALRKEIVITLAIKFVFLYGLWFFFFQQPETESPMEHQIERTLFGGPAPSDPQSNSTSNSQPIPIQGAEAW